MSSLGNPTVQHLHTPSLSKMVCAGECLNIILFAQPTQNIIGLIFHFLNVLVDCQYLEGKN